MIVAWRHRSPVVFALLVAGTAHANIFDLFGAGARAQAMAGAVTAVSADHLATFHNPAGLTDAPAAVGVSFTGNFNRSTIRLMPRPEGYDPPGYASLRSPRSDTEGPGGVLGIAAGVTFKLLDDDLSIGAVLFAPFSGLASAQTRFPDEREQYHSNRLSQTIVGERANTEVIALGLSYRVLDWLSMGVGLMILPESLTRTSVYTPNPADPAHVDTNLKLSQTAREAILIGVVAQPLEWLRVGAVFQDELFFRVSGHNDIILGDALDAPVRQDMEYFQHYSPPRVSGSLAVTTLNGLTTAVEATWRGWDRMVNDHGERAGFESRVDWKLGIEYPYAETTFLRAGLGWHPTPVPQQSGRTNYVDSDRVGLGLGAGRAFDWGGERFTLDFGVQVHRMLDRTVFKRAPEESGAPVCGPGVATLCDEVPDRTTDTPLQRAADTAGLQTGNPGFPGYAHGGYLVAASLDLKWLF